jgi:hypothetical protein
VAAEVSLRRQVEIGDWAERILDLLPAEDEPRTVYWLLWAGHRHAQVGAPRDLRRAAPPPWLRRAPRRAVQPHVHGKRRHRLPGRSLAAIDWLRERGEGHAANLLEVSGVAASLIVLQRFDELADVASEMVDLHSRYGPPMLHYFALGMQAYAAQYRGRHEEVRRLFDEAERLALPAGTYRVLQTAQARLTFETGDHVGACRILPGNIEVLLDSD